MFELFKLEQTAKQHQAAIANRNAQNPAVINSMNANSAAQRALAEQKLKEQQFQGAMQLLQQSQKYFNPPARKPTTTCQFNPIIKNMVCR